MATEYGDGYGGQPWHGAPQPYADPSRGGPSHAGPPHAGPPYASRWQRPGRVTSVVAWAALVLGSVGFVGSAVGVLFQVAPRQFTAAQRRQLADWESATRWRTLTAGEIFPPAVRYAPPASLGDDASLVLTARRIGIAGQAPCRVAADTAAAAILVRNHCQALLRATYTDGTDSYVVTVGAAALPGAAAAAAAQRQLVSAGTSGHAAPTVHTVPFGGTPAGAFSNPRRQVSGAIAKGAYVVLYAIGYADPRPRQPVSADSYGYAEMTSFGAGVARAVLAVLGKPVPPPRCPGTPGC